MATDRVTSAFPISPLASRIFSITAAVGISARIVGGAVRDWLQERPIGDIDMAVAMPVADAVLLFRDEGLKVVETGFEHGTVTVVGNDEAIEVTQTRVDLDTDGRHATVAFSDDWRLDASRRDFTVNALYVTADGIVDDPLDCGRMDLASGRLRFVGDAVRRVEEDALRMLRFCRFLPRFSDGGIDADALAALVAASPLSAGLSGERIAAELRRLLGESDGQIGLQIMQQTGLSRHAVGLDMAPDRLTPQIDRLADVVAQEEPNAWLIRLAVAIPAASATALSSRLHLSRRESALLSRLDLDSPETELEALSGPRWRHAAYWCHRGGGLPAAHLLVAAARLMRAVDERHFSELCAWKPPLFPLTGAELLSYGVDKGPAVGEMLRDAERIWVSQDFVPTKEQLVARIGLNAQA